MKMMQGKNFIFLLFCCTLVNCNLPKNTPIIIVGGGAAGISALSRLLEHGYSNITLLEAEDRIGGRINTVPFAANVLDLGAQWVTGRSGNVIYEMIKGHNMLDMTPSNYFFGDVLSSEGEQNPDYLDLFRICSWIFRGNDDCRNYWARPYGDFFMERFNQEINKSENLHITSKNKRDYIRHFEKTVTAHFAIESWFRISTSFCTEQYVHPGRWLVQNWKDKGFSTVFDFITKKRPDPSNDLKVERKIELNKEVSEIDYTEHDLGVVRVKTSDGQTYVASHVIVTVPLGVLKATHKTMFKPPLSAVKINSIENIYFGVMNKIAFEFSPAFWSEGWGGFSLVWTEQGLAEVVNSQYSWTKSILGVFQTSYQPNILVGWIVGEDAKIIESLSDDELTDGLMYTFSKFLTGFNYSRPIRVLTSSWYSNPHFRGSFSARTVETDLQLASALDLSLPIFNNFGLPSVLFAGEATNPTNHSLTDGAVETGFREAMRLIHL